MGFKFMLDLDQFLQYIVFLWFSFLEISPQKMKMEVLQYYENLYHTIEYAFTPHAWQVEAYIIDPKNLEALKPRCIIVLLLSSGYLTYDVSKPPFINFLCSRNDPGLGWISQVKKPRASILYLNPAQSMVLCYLFFSVSTQCYIDIAFWSKRTPYDAQFLKDKR